MAKVLTAITVEKLKPKATRYEVPDAGQRNMYVCVFPSGVKSYICRYRYGGKKYKLTFGGMSLAAARKATADAMYKLHEGINPKDEHKAKAEKAIKANANTFRAVCEKYLQQDGHKLRTAAARKATLENLVYPQMGDLPVNNLRRGDIITLLDAVETKSGPVQADRTLAIVRKVLRWYAVRDEDFIVPIVPGMARTKPKERARDRVLDDAELRLVCQAAENRTDPFAVLVQFLLLTAARRNEAAHMTWDEVSGTDWILPASRNKTKQPLVRPLSQKAQALLASMPHLGPYIFTTYGKRPFGGFGRFKKLFDNACGVTGWTLHDLRRTARSLMSRARVNADHAERCLGHVIGGIRGTYDRHEFHKEKQEAFEALAAQIGRIVNPPKGNVRQLRG
ncbi:MAG: integrase arm-type DNA-binding domain-containing protein [Xanthobacteraceae bacterium]